jgi:hypothetical protein
MSEEPADQAEVIRHALMIEGRTLMPAFSMAMTKGDEAASLVSERPSELEGVMMPMMKTPRM